MVLRASLSNAPGIPGPTKVVPAGGAATVGANDEKEPMPSLRITDVSVIWT